MKNKPPYALASVDNALLLVLMLRDHGSLRVSEAAEELGIARSTAHRLLSMLVYRDFAVQDDRRTYVPGPALAASRVAGQPLQQLRRCLTPHLDALCQRVQETTNLIVRVGVQVRFLASVESTQVLHVVGRQGTILPAHLTSGGKALLAELGSEQLERLYVPPVPASTGITAEDAEPSLSQRSWTELLRELDTVRDHGYSLNIEGSEAGVSAVGACVYGTAGSALAAVSISTPSARFDKQRIPVLVRELKATVSQAQEDLRSLPQS
ncbi:DNA-binding IclR family transcriptional regulator [Saccharopolyspora lacisalsi]|uniref:DNA-binding IclR family transcriptional regulator n=1 Tax=Halosaccharopolyspora lacisalsi TaxID=1000566 RepID=A0A839DU65_9PSEU|nr:IclR family transcriptional regulator [Halosaccharopolyspora lacisalsi]MBA8825034.1 DNA-binding IclR family transcriptional regulator [Halosaccharopolyspora lacisalsi]MBA8826537.1 DNA-binding IclR family transcriptional regulator [Halosaccharopolyspora lacisalsi]